MLCHDEEDLEEEPRVVVLDSCGDRLGAFFNSRTRAAFEAKEDAQTRCEKDNIGGRLLCDCVAFLEVAELFFVWCCLRC